MSDTEKLMRMNRLDQLASAAGGTVVCGSPDTAISGLFSDTRTPLPGGLFVALRGDNFDGNRFAKDAVERCGAAAVLLDRPDAANTLPQGAGAILVDDTRQALLGIATRHRQTMTSALWFAVTGSVGKSSTKEMLAHLLEHGARLSVHKAKASFNNAVGLSHTILGATPEHQAVVLEVGTNHPGEIRQLTTAALPNIAVITCAAESHLESFRTVKNVAKEKGAILAFQQPADTAVLNADDANLPLWVKTARGKRLLFGTAENADVRAKHVELDAEGCPRFMVRYKDEAADCVLRVPGVHQVHNALAAMAAAAAAGVRLDCAARALESFKGVARRFAVRQVRGITLIDDAYNANPASFASALETLKTFTGRRKFVVAGDMLELGIKSADYHRALGRKLAGCELTKLVTVGALAALAGAAATEKKNAPKNWIACPSAEEAAAALKPLLREDDVVLVKGSHGMQLERCVQALEAPPTAP